jgi:hypothetical protein
MRWAVLGCREWNCYFWSASALLAIPTELSLLLQVLCSIHFLFFPALQNKILFEDIPLCHCYSFRLLTRGVRGSGAEVGKLAQGIHWLAEGFGLPSGDKGRKTLYQLRGYTLFHIGPSHVACTIKALFVSHVLPQTQLETPLAKFKGIE